MITSSQHELSIGPARSNVIDLIRLLAMVGVIIAHTLISFASRPDFADTTAWWFFEPLAIFASQAVPLFFMLSGFLVLNKTSTIATNLRRTATRLLFPLFIFFWLYVLYELFINPFSFSATFALTTSNFLTNIMGHALWFLIFLSFYYLLNPLWQLLFTSSNKSLAKYVVALLFIAPFLVNALAFLVSPISLQSPIHSSIAEFLLYAGFYLLGGLIRQQWLPSWKTRSLLTIIAIVFLFNFGYDYLTLHPLILENSLINIIYQIFSFAKQLGLLTYILVVPLFICLLKVDLLKWFKNPKLKAFYLKLTSALAKLSFGVYLIHSFYLQIFHHFLGWHYDQVNDRYNVYIFSIVSFGGVFLLSLFTSWLISKLPYVRKIIGLK